MGLEKQPLISHLSIYAAQGDKYLGAGIHGGGLIFLEQMLVQAAKHGFAAEVITNSPEAGVIFQRRPHMKTTSRGQLYVEPGIARLPLTPETTRSGVPLLLTDEKLLDQASKLYQAALKERPWAVPFAHHYTSAVVAQHHRDLNRPLIVIPHTLNVFRTLEQGGHLGIDKPLVTSSSEIHSLLMADLVVLFTKAELKTITDMLNRVVRDPIFLQMIKNTSLRQEDAEKLAAGLISRCHIIPLGVDHQEFDPILQTPDRKREARRKMGLPIGNAFIFGVIGRIARIKNIETAIDAFNMFLQENPNKNAYLAIFGGDIKDLHESGTYMNQLLKRIGNKKNKELINRIIFTGSQKSTDIMSAIDVEISASFSETWGLAITEAMAVGIPTIVSDTPIMREVTNDTQLYFNPHKPLALVRQMKEVYKSAKLREEIGRAGHELAKNFNWEETALELARAAIDLGLEFHLFTKTTINQKMRRFEMTEAEEEILRVFELRSEILQRQIADLKLSIDDDRTLLPSPAKLTQDNRQLSDLKLVFSRIEEKMRQKDILARELWLFAAAELALRIGDLPRVIEHLNLMIESYNRWIEVHKNNRLLVAECIKSRTMVEQMKAEIEQVASMSAVMNILELPEKTDDGT